MRRIIMCISIVFLVIFFSGCSNQQIETPSEKCEKLGGFYQSGGFWDLPDKCVFPPK